MQFTLFHSTTVLVIAAGACLAMTIISLTRRSTPASLPFALLMLAVAFWLFFVGMEDAAVDLQGKILFSKFQYLGIPYVAPLELVFVWAYIRQENWLTPRRLALVFSIPVLATLLAITNEFHQLIWASVTISPSDPNIAVYNHGPAFWVMTAQSYFCILATIYFLVRVIGRYPRFYRQQIFSLLLGVAFPVVANIASLTGLIQVKGLDITPLGFVVSGIIYGWVLLRFQLLRLVPIAREALVENMRDAVLVLDAQNQVVDFNPAASRLFGMDATLSMGASIVDISPIIAGYRGSREIQDEIALPREKPLYMDLRITPLRDWRHRLNGRLVVLHNITAMKEAQLEAEKLYQAEQRRAQELNAVRSITMDLSAGFELGELLLRILTRALELLRVTVGELALFDPNQNDLEIIISHGLSENHTGQHMALGEGVMGAVALSRQPLLVDDYNTWQGRSSQYQDIGYFTSLGVPLMAGDELLGVIVVGDSGSERHFSPDELDLFNLFAQEAALAIHNARLFEQMKVLATHDTLTGLYNRRNFFKLAAVELERTVRYKKPLAAIMLDIDKFKKVNDTYGHAAGDQVLQGIAHLCLQSIRIVDIIGRYGGEEFSIILPEADVEQAMIVAERLCAVIASTPFETGRGPVKLTASLGVAALDPEHADLDVLLDQADQALYLAKQNRNQVKVYTS